MVNSLKSLTFHHRLMLCNKLQTRKPTLSQEKPISPLLIQREQKSQVKTLVQHTSSLNYSMVKNTN